MFFKYCMKNSKHDEIEKFPIVNLFTCTVIEDQNHDSKKTMEDFTIVELDLLENNRWALFCILDGHGGTQVANYTKINYPNILRKSMSKNPTESPVDLAIKQSIETLSKELEQQEKFN